MRRFTPEYLSEQHREVKSISELEDAIQSGKIIEALVTSCSDDLTLELSLGKDIIGTVSFSEIEYRVDNTEIKPIVALSKVGRHIKVIPKSFTQNEEGKYIVECSRKEVQQQCYINKISWLVPGDVVDARVLRIENYGIFCDIGCGIVALLPTNLISVTHIVNSKELLSDTRAIRVVIKDIQSDGKIQLSHRELIGTWDEESSKFKVGQTVCGTVLSVEEYGVFIRLSQNLSGLASVPSSDIKLKTGDVVSVHIGTIANHTMKVKLNIVGKIDNCDEIMKFNYYGDRETSYHIDNWIYTSQNNKSKKYIETVFCNKISVEQREESRKKFLERFGLTDMRVSDWRIEDGLLKNC